MIAPTTPLFRPALLLMGSALAFVLVAGSPAFAKAKPGSRGVEAPNQPVVQRTDFIFDATPDGYNGVSREERQRMVDWFDAIELGYGDRVSIVDDGMSSRASIAGAVSSLIGQYGLLLADRAPVTVGQAASGAVRIVVSRATATVPGCPGWDHQSETDYANRLTSEYGCGVNGNLAAMVADPEDLVHGRGTRTDLRTATSSRAIKALRDATPTGNGNILK